METDEFEIKATGHPTGLLDRTWTRSKLAAATSIADQAVQKLGYTRAEVINTFGGHRSQPIYIVTPEGGAMQPEC
jgi:hypothetical protein